MNDRFKFRVWDKEYNKMFTPPRHFNYCIVNGTIVCIESFCQYDGFYQKRIIKEFDDAILMQSTGLKDKNGKLIYEGDILRLKDIKIPVEVRFRGIGFELYAEPSNMAGYHNDKYIPENSEVIGNIYENKELLDER